MSKIKKDFDPEKYLKEYQEKLNKIKELEKNNDYLDDEDDDLFEDDNSYYDDDDD